MWCRTSLLRFALIFSVLFAFSANAFAQNLDEGKTIFRNQCGSCHNKDMKSNMTGPALGGVQERWADYPQEDLYKWIRNSQAMISEGHPRAVELWDQYKPVIMNNFPTLTDEQIDNVLAYVQDVYVNGGKKKTEDVAGDAVVAAEKPDNTLLYVGLLAILGVLAVVLARVISNLNYLSQVESGVKNPHRKSLVEILTSRGVIGFGLFALIVLGGYTTVNNAINLGRQQGYQPEQPIKFSHVTHANVHKIECQYCHDGARRSKHSVIPAANTCMNCHKAIKVGSKYGTGELSKIFASIGFDPNKDEYIENYDEMSEDDIKKIFTTWIGNSYVEENGSLDSEGELLIEDQWDEIVSSLTNDEKPQVQGPIEWTRIHNLPDHVYFNHSQHVSVGKLECQTCHGKIEEMEEVYQYSNLSMGWCINCHRETEVQFKDNEYYETWERYHEELGSGEKEKVTVEDIGGLECQKCHY